MECSHREIPISQSADAYLQFQVFTGFFLVGLEISYLISYFSSVKSGHIPACQHGPLRTKDKLHTLGSLSVPHPPPRPTSACGFPPGSTLDASFIACCGRREGLNYRRCQEGQALCHTLSLSLASRVKENAVNPSNTKQ